MIGLVPRRSARRRKAIFCWGQVATARACSPLERAATVLRSAPAVDQNGRFPLAAINKTATMMSTTAMIPISRKLSTPTNYHN